MLFFPLKKTSFKIVLFLVLLLFLFLLVKPGGLLAALSYQLVDEWGGLGSADGDLRYPGGMAIDSSGTVFVADTQNHRIQMFDANGVFLGKWATQFGSGQPVDIAISPSGFIYVTVSSFHRMVKKFNPAGALVAQWGGVATFNKPAGISLDSSENVYVVDDVNDRIRKFDSDGNHIKTWGSSAGSDGLDPGEFNVPTGIAIDQNDKVYVTDYSANRIQRFDKNGNFEKEWGKTGSDNGEFRGPWGIEVGPSGSIFITDSGNARVQEFDTNGGFISKWGITGTLTSLYYAPRGIVVNAGGAAYITDSPNNYVKKFAKQVVTTKPTGTVLINNGAAKTSIGAVRLTLLAKDASGNDVKSMRFSNDHVNWSTWGPYSLAKGWVLEGRKGKNTVYAQFKDDADLISNTVSDSIELTKETKDLLPGNSVKLMVKLNTPRLTTRYYNRTTFKVRWWAYGTLPSSGIASYDVQYKVGKGGGWRNWLMNTNKKSSNFKGRQGKSYYLRARARDNLSHVGRFSKPKRTIVPYDNNRLIRKRAGFGHTLKKIGSKYYLRTVRYSTNAGDAVTYRFKGNRVAVISTKARNRSKAKIYVDGKYKRTVKTATRRTKYRRAIYQQKFRKMSRHTITIVNVGDRDRLDLDGLAVGR